MPKIERWENFPEGVRQHLIERMRDRAIRIADLNHLRLWIETQPETPDGIGTRIVKNLRTRRVGKLVRGQVATADKL
jgi:hypothetical protein